LPIDRTYSPPAVLATGDQLPPAPAVTGLESENVTAADAVGVIPSSSAMVPTPI
jgi:hypothetical protein